MSDAPSAPAEINVAGLLSALESEIGILRCIVFAMLHRADADDLRRLTEAVEAYAARWQPSIPVSPADKTLLMSVNAGRASVFLAMLRQHPAVRAAANDATPYEGALQ